MLTGSTPLGIVSPSSSLVKAVTLVLTNAEILAITGATQIPFVGAVTGSILIPLSVVHRTDRRTATTNNNPTLSIMHAGGTIPLCNWTPGGSFGSAGDTYAMAAALNNLNYSNGGLNPTGLGLVLNVGLAMNTSIGDFDWVIDCVYAVHKPI